MTVSSKLVKSYVHKEVEVKARTGEDQLIGLRIEMHDNDIHSVYYYKQKGEYVTGDAMLHSNLYTLADLIEAAIQEVGLASAS